MHRTLAALPAQRRLPSLCATALAAVLSVPAVAQTIAPAPAAAAPANQAYLAQQSARALESVCAGSNYRINFVATSKGPCADLYAYQAPSSGVGAPTAAQAASAAAGLASYTPDRHVAMSRLVTKAVASQFAQVQARLNLLRDQRLLRPLLTALSAPGGAPGAPFALLAAPGPSSPPAAPPTPLPPASPTPPAAPAPAPAPSPSPGPGGDRSPAPSAPAASPRPVAAADEPLQTRTGWYLHAESRRGSAEGDTLETGSRLRGSNLALGADYRFTPSWVAGFSLTTDRSRAEISPGASTAGDATRTRGSALAAYAAVDLSETGYAQGILIAGQTRFDTTRHVLLGSTARPLFGTSKGRHWGLSLGGGTNLRRGELALNLYGQGVWSAVRIDGFDESAGAGSEAELMALRMQPQRFDSLSSQLGLRVSWAMTAGRAVWVPSLGVEWEHQFRDDRTPLLSGILLHAPGSTAITVATTRPDRDWLNLSLGLAAHFDVGRSALVNVKHVLGRAGVRDTQLAAEVRVEF